MIYISAIELEPIQSLYDRGLYLQAYRAASELGPLKDWRGGPARVLAGRLARNLGAPRLGQGHHLLALREDSDLAEVRFFYVFTVIERRGPYAAWRLLKEFGDLEDASATDRSNWYTLHAMIASYLRDFDTAEEWLAKADSAMPARAWVSVVRSGVLQVEDRYEESLDEALEALSLHPWYRPAVESAASGHVLLGNDEAALAILREAEDHIESAAVVQRRLALLVELQRYEEVQNQFDRLAELMPMMEKEVAQHFAAWQSDVAYFLGDYESAVSFGRESDSPFLKSVADNLTKPGSLDGQRVSLPLPFIRQHRQTCVPATLTIISRYWSQPAEHLQIAARICYNGTTAYSERSWAEQNNWLAREFTVTEESLKTLIDLGVPFALETAYPGYAHMQAVRGYDSRRGTVLIRDPYYRQTGESLIEDLLNDQAANGPRGMAIVPIAQRGILDAVELPDEDLYDQLHQFDAALERNRWPEAEKIYQEMLAQAPSHRLTLRARMRLALYDTNTVALLAAVDSLLELYPDNDLLTLTRLSCLSELGRRDELLRSYEALRGDKNIHPVFTVQYAQELAVEPRERDRAVRLLSRAMRRWPTDAGSYMVLGNVLWQQQQYEDAVELFRFAICLEDKQEEYARSFFGGSLFLQQEEKALAFLRRRWERFRGQSSLTARTLAWAYTRLERYPEAISVLDETIRDHPEDGELMLEAANLLAQESGDDRERALELLASARPKAPLRQWLRSAARMALAEGKSARALAYWQQLLEIQPLAIDAHEAVVGLLATTQNHEAAAAHLQKYTDQFPHYYPLHVVQAEWYNQAGQNEAYLLAAQKLVDLAPQNDSGLTHLGNALLLNEKPSEAYKSFQLAFDINPANIRAGFVLFDQQIQREDLDRASETLKILEEKSDGPFTMTRAIQLALLLDDVDLAVSTFKKLCVTPDASGQALGNALISMEEAGKEAEIIELLNEAILSPKAVPAVGGHWMFGCLRSGNKDCEVRLQELTARGAIGVSATRTYFYWLIDARQKDRFGDFIKYNRDWLSKNPVLCSNVVTGLQQLGQDSEALSWVKDLVSLEGLMPWMLITPVELFWEADRLDEVEELCQRALLFPPDSTVPVHRIWLAAAAAFSGNANEALDWLGLVDPIRLSPHGRFQYEVTEAVVQISLVEVSGRWQVFRNIRHRLQHAFSELKDAEQNISVERRFYRQALRQIAREAGDIRVWIWCYRQIFRSSLDAWVQRPPV